MSITNKNIWQRKIMAFLHDPPQKAYDFSVAHEEAAKKYSENFGFAPEAWSEYREFDKTSDRSASAADRFIMPKANFCSEKGISFIHPLSGERIFTPNEFPQINQATELFEDICPAFSDKTVNDKERFFLLWRLWLEFSAGHAKFAGKGAELMPFLPADTRIPDHTIWHHIAVTSALEATRDITDSLTPAFLLFQLGPVQEFIAQARSTRDLWSGSYMLSWLTAHAIKQIVDEFGPDCIIFPSLRRLPLFDWFYRDILKKASYPGATSTFWNHLDETNANAFEAMALTPAIPNRFLAVVPASYDPEAAVTALQNEWANIANVCLNWLQKKNLPLPHLERFNFQIKNAWHISWQLWPWQNVEKALDELKNIPGINENESPLHLAYNIASKIPLNEQDFRCTSDGKPNSSAWAWSAHYQLCQYRLDARRQTREFAAWQGHDFAVKDVYSGKEETVFDEQWLESARNNSEIAHLFRKEKEFLGAVNLIKRIWHKAYLAEKHGLKPAAESFDSVMAVAAAPWRTKLLAKLPHDTQAWSSLIDFQAAIQNAKHFLNNVPPENIRESRWLQQLDPEVFYLSFWEKGYSQINAETLEKGKTALKKLIEDAKIGEPGKYYAVLAMDGDKMGKWLSGVKTPPIEKILSPNAAAYFKKQNGIEKWLKSPRYISPAYHLQFSEALANFGLYCARRIVEHHHGQMIYTGGDDVLAMLPAEEAVPCALGLRMAFQGDEKLPDRYPYLFKKTKRGLVLLNDGDIKNGCRLPFEPSWPLLVPGPSATASIGIAIGHVKEPLQDMVQSAQEAEKRAKQDLKRNALVITLFKRSGEQILWGTKFSQQSGDTHHEIQNAAFELLEFLDKHYKPPLDNPDMIMPISGKFPYRICELAKQYEVIHAAGDSRTPLTDELCSILAQEIKWAVARLAGENKQNTEIFEKLEELCIAWLQACCAASATLSDFYNLFALEAFVVRKEKGE